MSGGTEQYPHDLRQVINTEYGLGQNRTWQLPRDTRDQRLQSMGLYDILDETIEPDDTVVEIGCSIGQTTQELAERYNDRGVDVIGVGLYSEFLADGNYVQAGASQLPFPEDAVDHVIAPNSLGRIVYKGLVDRTGDAATEDYVDAVLSEVARVTPEKGMFLLADGEQGSSYLHAENTGDGLTLQECCSYEGTWRSRSAEHMYRDWLDSDQLDTNDYDETAMTLDDLPDR